MKQLQQHIQNSVLSAIIKGNGNETREIDPKKEIKRDKEGLSVCVKERKKGAWLYYKKVTGMRYYNMENITNQLTTLFINKTMFLRHYWLE